jgi:hypothetical protein
MGGIGYGLIYVTCLEGLRKITRKLRQNGWSAGLNFNISPPKYEAGVLTYLP